MSCLTDLEHGFAFLNSKLVPAQATKGHFRELESEAVLKGTAPGARVAESAIRVVFRHAQSGGVGLDALVTFRAALRIQSRNNAIFDRRLL